MRIESGSFAATHENTNKLSHQGDPECREEKVTLIGEKPVEECQVGEIIVVYLATNKSQKGSKFLQHL